MLALLCAAIVTTSLLGGALPLAAVLTHTRLQLYLSFAAGAMLGAAFFHMMPEAVHLGSAGALRWSAAGLLALFFLERFFAFHHHEAPSDPAEPCPPHAHSPHDHGRGHSAGLVNPSAPGGGGSKGSALPWGAAAFGLAVHSLVGGVALASVVTADMSIRGGLGPATWGVFLATVVHKPADALTIVSLMLRGGVPRGTAHLVNLGFALMIPAGAVVFVVGLRGLGADWSGAITADSLAFSAGTFLCVALSDLLPELQFHAHDRVKLSAALLAGVGLMAAAGGFEGGDHAPPAERTTRPAIPTKSDQSPD